MKKKWYLKTIGPIIFVFILTKIDIKTTFSVLTKAKPSYIIFACFVVFPLSLLLRTYKWNNILKINGIYFSFSKAVVIYYIGLSINIFLPANVGTFSKTYYLTREGHPIGMSFMTTGYDKLFELMAIMTIMLLSFGKIAPLLYGNYEIILKNILIFCCLVMSLLVSGFIFKRQLFIILDKLYFHLALKWKNKMSSVEYNSLKNSLFNMKSYDAISFLVLSMIIKLIEYILIYFLALSLSIPLSFLSLLFCANLFATFSFLPVSFNGIGIRDATFLFFFPLFGINGDIGVSLAFLMLFTTIIMQSLGLIGLYKYPLISVKESGDDSSKK